MAIYIYTSGTLTVTFDTAAEAAEMMAVHVSNFPTAPFTIEYRGA